MAVFGHLPCSTMRFFLFSTRPNACALAHPAVITFALDRPHAPVQIRPLVLLLQRPPGSAAALPVAGAGAGAGAGTALTPSGTTPASK